MNTQSSIPITTEFEDNLKKYRFSTIDLYLFLWAPFMLVQSVVVLPVKGATLGYLLALLSPMVVLFFGDKNNRNRYIKLFILSLFFYSIITLLSQFGNIIFDITHTNLTLVDETDTRLYFRKTLLTQSLYLLAGFLTFLYIKDFYKNTWEKYFFIGAGLLAFYGIYEVIYFLIFGERGDFLSNRIVGNVEFARIDGLFQIINIGKISIMRLKSLTGEPSMYSFTILPFCIYAFHTERYKIAALLFSTLVLSTSTTAILGIMLYIFFNTIFMKVTKKWLNGIFILIVAILGFIFFFLEDLQILYQTQVINKITLQNFSGTYRFESFIRHLNYYITDMNLWSQLVGLGFGTVRSTDLVSTLLINTGIIGFFIFTIAFFYPIFKLKNNYRNNGIKISLIVIYVTAMISVPEFGYLSVWIFLGIAYHQLNFERQL
jgi:hypothetical protein